MRADHQDRQHGPEVGDEVHGRPVELVDQAIDVLDDQGPGRFDHRRCEGAVDQRPQAGVLGRVDVEQERFFCVSTSSRARASGSVDRLAWYVAVAVLS